MFVCEEHQDKWLKETGCTYCREERLQQQVAELQSSNEFMSEIIERDKEVVSENVRLEAQVAELRAENAGMKAAVQSQIDHNKLAGEERVASFFEELKEEITDGVSSAQCRPQ